MKKENEDNRTTGEVFVAIPLLDIFRTLKSMPHCPISHHITERERIDINKIAHLLHIDMPDELDWDSFVNIIVVAYGKIGDIGLYTKISQKEADQLYNKLVEEGG